MHRPARLLPEQLLRDLWWRQAFRREGLRTADGRPLRIIHPGLLNEDAGPDFLGARIRIGPVLYSGAVELHADAASWAAHGHARDPHYNGVILHVAAAGDVGAPPARTASGREVPLLLLPVPEDLAGTGRSLPPAVPAVPLEERPCLGDTGALSAAALTSWLEELAAERIEAKIRRYRARLDELAGEPGHAAIRRPAPWEQLMYEGVMEAMGYTKNSGAFLRLARMVPLERLRHLGAGEQRDTLALLLGSAGLLPPARRIRSREARVYTGLLRRRWCALRPLVPGERMHEAEWLFFRLRPANFPTARLAAVSFLIPRLFGRESFRRIIDTFREEGITDAARARRLRAGFRFTPDAFWSRHCLLHGVRAHGGARLGSARINDILVNVLVPIALLYARIFHDGAVRQHARSMLAILPPLQPNRITTPLARLMPEVSALLRTAVLQQGALQLRTCYCLHDRCGDCPLGRAAAPVQLS